MAASTRTALADGHKYLGAFVVVVALFSVSTSLHAQNLYGSMAFAQTGDGGYAWGIAWNAQGRSMARQLAIDECRWAGGGSGCREVGGFRNACGAIAIGDGDGYGTGWGDSSGEAERTAMNECRSQNNTCHIEISRCTELSAAVGIDRATRRRIQLALAAQGFDPGSADGIFGQKTQAALRAWQAAKGYATTGNLTSEQARILQSLQPQRAKASVKPDAPKKKADDVLWGSKIAPAASADLSDSDDCMVIREVRDGEPPVHGPSGTHVYYNECDRYVHFYEIVPSDFEGSRAYAVNSRHYYPHESELCRNVRHETNTWCQHLGTPNAIKTCADFLDEDDCYNSSVEALRGMEHDPEYLTMIIDQRTNIFAHHPCLPSRCDEVANSFMEMDRNVGKGVGFSR